MLDRCIRTALKCSSIARKSTWFVIDDSSNMHQRHNSIIVQKLKSKIPIFHVTPSKQKQICRIVSDEIDSISCKATFSKQFSRDISGLRNMGILVARLLNPRVVFFIDDDIVVQKNNDFFNSVVKHYKNNKNCIVGATLTGIIDESYYGRLLYLVNKDMSGIFKVSAKSQSISHRRNPLWLEMNEVGRGGQVDNTSAGLLAFRPDSRNILPFPSGYNEDWNWCLLQKLIMKTRIFRDAAQVLHSPPTIYQPNSTGMIWELHGEIIFESIFRAMCKKGISNFEALRSSVKETGVLDSTVKEMVSLKNELYGLLAKAKKSDDREIIQMHLDIVEETITSLHSLDVNGLLKNWFINFEKRRNLFATIFNRTRLQTRLLNALEASRLQ